MKSFKELRDELAIEITKSNPDEATSINQRENFKLGFDIADELHREAAQGLVQALQEVNLAFFHKQGRPITSILKALEAYRKKLE
jgi:hypothetical protein